MRLLISLGLSRYGLVCRYRKIFQISLYNWMQNCISDTWHNNFQLDKTKTET